MPQTEKTNKDDGQVSLTQMLKALDKDLAAGIGKRLKKLSKKKAVQTPLDEQKAAQVERKAAYSEVSKDITKWDPIVERNKRAKQLNFPLDHQPDVLPSVAESISNLRPKNELEKEVLNVSVSKDNSEENEELTKAEEKYLKAISAEEAQDRHKELQRMRVLLSSYGAKMRRQKAIKSKSYHRLLKRERIKKHVKMVESSKDHLLDEIERLQRLRAKERASLKHKNTGKWAKHAKFRSKYDEEARKAMLEQIGIASKLLERPALPESESDDDDHHHDETEDDDEISDVSRHSSDDEGAKDTISKTKPTTEPNVNERLIISSELIDSRSSRKRKSGPENDDDDVDDIDDDEDDDDDQRKLMCEAFANDDVVSEFRKAKDQLANEEQPKDVNLFLPGWGDWAGPGIKINRRKKKKYLIKAKKIDRQDDKLGDVIISEKASDEIKELQIKKLPRGFKNEEKLAKILTKPTTASFSNQMEHRESIRPRVQTRMGARIEPLSQKVLQGGNKAKWA